MKWNLRQKEKKKKMGRVMELEESEVSLAVPARARSQLAAEQHWKNMALN